ncbi:MAG: high potential iron sulfur protein [Alphaproteobacteria bacterium]|nr:high potential iron sulfur protein [Alphaproteobacteria bacterium]
MAGVLRRRLLSVAASSIVAGSAARASGEQQKVSQAEAQYQDRPKNGLSCATCALFRPPAACAVVSGIISPNGWCRFFDLPD